MFKVIIVAFFVIRIVMSLIKANSSNEKKPTIKKAKKTTELSLEDLMKEIQQKKEAPRQTTIQDNNHKAKEDSHKKLDWQEVHRTKLKQKEPLIARPNAPISSIKSIPEMQQEIDSSSSSSEIADKLNNVDLKTAVLYKEILDRKYFSI